MKITRKNIFIIELMLILALIFILILILVNIIKTQPKQYQQVVPIKVELSEGNSKKTEKIMQTTLDWAETVERKEPTLTVWNRNTKEGILLQDGQEYSLKEGDSIVLCFDEKKKVKLSLGFGVACQVGKGKCFYSMIIQQKLEEPTKLSFNLTVDNVEYTKTLYLLTET